jgi:hypothetical protein
MLEIRRSDWKATWVKLIDSFSQLLGTNDLSMTMTLYKISLCNR